MLAMKKVERAGDPKGLNGFIHYFLLHVRRSEFQIGYVTWQPGITW